MWAPNEHFSSVLVLDKGMEIQELRWRPAVVTLQLIPFLSLEADSVAPAHYALIPAPGKALLSPRAMDKPLLPPRAMDKPVIYTLGRCIRGQTG